LGGEYWRLVEIERVEIETEATIETESRGEYEYG
jgi:hypothetical protein